MSKELISLVQRLADTPGASGFEDEVVAVAREYAQGLGEIQEDFLRNLYIYRKENRGNRPVIMLDAHTDEVGFIIHSIKPNGTLRFLPLGSWNKGSVGGTKVRVRNAEGKYISGIVASKPVHFQSAAEKAGGGADLEDMVIDIGAVSAQDAVENFGIRIGEPVVPDVKCEYDEVNDILFGKAFDDRVGCAVLLEVLRRRQPFPRRSGRGRAWTPRCRGCTCPRRCAPAPWCRPRCPCSSCPEAGNAGCRWA